MFPSFTEFFGFAAIFDWLTFARLNDEEIKKIKGRNPQDREERQARARINLYALGNYFLISFLFYSIALIGDYLYWHTSHPLAVILTKNAMFSVTLASFFIATVILPVPLAILANLPRLGKDLSDLRLAPFDITLAFCCLSAGCTVYMWEPMPEVLNYLPAHSPLIPVFQWVYFLAGLVPFLGLYICLRYYWKGDTYRTNIIVTSLVIIYSPTLLDVVLRILFKAF